MNSDKPLRDRTIVLTRPRAQAEGLASALEGLGAQIMFCPTIEIAEPDNYHRLDDAIDHFYGYDWIVFTSVNGVDYFFRRFNHLGHEVGNLDELRVCAIGDATAERLRELQIHVDVVPAEFKAEGVFTALQHFLGGSEQLQGLNFLIPSAAVARNFLPKALTDAGARVDVVPAYRTVLPMNIDRARLATILAGGADCIAFTSSSTVRNLARLFDTHDLSEALADVVIACLGDVTAQTAVEYGLQVRIQPQQFTIPALVDAIAAFFAGHES